MVDENEKLKNLKDLQYSKILNQQNISLGFIGGFMISFFFADLPSLAYFSLFQRASILALVGLLIIIYFRKRLDNLERDIMSI